MSALSLTQVHEKFVAALPAMQSTIAYQFRHLPRRCRAEAVADGVAACWHCWHGLLNRGEDPSAISPTGIAANAVRYVRGGRRLGTGTSGRGNMDVFNPRARRARGYSIVSLDQGEEDGPGSSAEAWREWLAQDNRVSPAGEAAFRLDFQAWLETLPPRKRWIAELLAEGHETSIVAGLVGVSPGRVSQIRSELADSWREYQAQAVAV